MDAAWVRPFRFSSYLSAALLAGLLHGVGWAQLDDGAVLAQRAAELLTSAFELCAKGWFEDAVARAREALSLTEKAYGRDDPSTAYVAGLVAFVCREAGLSEDAAGLIERALAIWEVARDDAKIVSALQSLGAVYSDLGDYERAAASLERALKIIIVCQTGAK